MLWLSVMLYVQAENSLGCVSLLFRNQLRTAVLAVFQSELADTLLTFKTAGGSGPVSFSLKTVLPSGYQYRLNILET